MLLIFVSMISAGAVAAESAEPNELGNNAALKYWKAFAMLPKLEEEDGKLLVKPSECPVNERTRQIVEKAKPSLKLMYKGAKIGPCDWGHDLTEGPNLLLPNIGKARDLARLAALRARVRMADGDADEGTNDLVATLRLAHHVGDHGTTLVETLVDYAMRNIAIETAASDLGAMTRAQREQLARILKELQPPTESGEIVRREREGKYGLRRRRPVGAVDAGS